MRSFSQWGNAAQGEFKAGERCGCPFKESAIASLPNAGWVGGRQPALGRRASVKEDVPAELVF